jgi:hypothetical protein
MHAATDGLDDDRPMVAGPGPQPQQPDPAAGQAGAPGGAPKKKAAKKKKAV